MNAVKKIGGINLAILLIYSVIARLSDTNGGNYKGMGFMMMMMLFVGLHVVINLIICLVHFSRRNKELGRAYLLSSILVLVIGFSTCWGIASVY
jgi:heme/copper-type cytochrome/quinol oxidase subunit 2